MPTEINDTDAILIVRMSRKRARRSRGHCIDSSQWEAVKADTVEHRVLPVVDIFRAGATARNENLLNRPGCFAEYTSLPESNVFKLSPLRRQPTHCHHRVNAYRLELARQMGASRTLDISAESLDEARK